MDNSPPILAELDACRMMMLAQLEYVLKAGILPVDSAALKMIRSGIHALEQRIEVVRKAATNFAKILTVSENYETINRLIGSLGDFTSVTNSNSFSNAIHILKTENIKLIIVDIRMQAEDGHYRSVFDLMRWVKGDPGLRAIPFVCLSLEPVLNASLTDGLRIATQALGASFLTMESFDQPLFRKRIEALLA